MKLSQLTLHALAFLGVLAILLTAFMGLVAAGQSRREKGRKS